MQQEMLCEVMPNIPVKLQEYTATYANRYQREQLEKDGYIPVDPLAESGIAVKVVNRLY